MSEVFKSIAEIFEHEIGSSLQARTEAIGNFQHLGPPDFVHVVKSLPRPNNKEVGSYHFVLGVDTSSSATLAAYMNSLTYSMDDTSGWFSKPQWKISSGTYCCYNALSKVDMRVEIHIPGGVDSYAMDPQGQRMDTTPELWLECYICSMLRCIWQDRSIGNLTAVRRLDPFNSANSETRFLDACASMFFQGWLLGSFAEIQTVNNANNFLALGIKKYFEDTQRAEIASNFFANLANGDPEILSLSVEALIEADQGIKAVRLMDSTLRQFPTAATMLACLSQFLRSKNQLENAIELAKMAVNCLPSEYSTWEKLCSYHVDSKDYGTVLITLNSSPMTPGSDKEIQVRMPPPAKVHIPSKEPADSSSIEEPDYYVTSPNRIDPALQRLQGSHLKGALKKAYSILTKIAFHIGWDELLKVRSDVFAMEEEYKQLRARALTASRESLAKPSPVVRGREVIEEVGEEKEEQHNGKHVSISPAKEVVNDDDANYEKQEESQEIENDAINEEDGNKEEIGQNEESKEHNDVVQPRPTTQRKQSVEILVENDAILKASVNELDIGSMVDPPIYSKRLCERWFDSLFMTLYEDLRVYTIWKAEAQHYKMQNLDYQRTAPEWEILGDLALRLHYVDDAKEAYHASIEHTFSLSSWKKLLEIYTDEGKLGHALNAAGHVALHLDKLFQLNIYPSLVGKCIFKLIRVHGLAKVKKSVTTLAVQYQTVLAPFFVFADSLKIGGYDY